MSRTYSTIVDSGLQEALLDGIAQVLRWQAGELAKADRYDDARAVLLDLLDETKNKEGDVFLYTDCGEDVAVTVDRNLLRFAGYMLTILEAE